MIEEIKRKDNETDFEYGLRMLNGKVEGLYDIDWQDIVDELNLNVHRDTLRKNFNKTDYCQEYGYSGYDILQYYKNNQITEDDLIKEIENKKIDLQKEKIKFQNQRTAFNKLVRERARMEELNDIIINTIKNSNFPKLEYIEKEYIPTDNDLMVSLNDIHYGMNINNAWNVYNSDICRDMFEEYLHNILQVQKTHKSQNCYVCANGDLISGFLHKAITVENKENVIQQIKGVSELISKFLFELSRHFEKVIFSSVAGNHSRLEHKDDAQKDERLDDLIQWYIEAKLQNVNNIVINNNKLDTTMYLLNVRGKNYLNTHGDYENSNYKILALASMVEEPVYAICLGHKHRNKSDYVQNIKVIMAGSFQSTDSYCVQKRIVGQPQQLICVCDTNGILCSYDINFKN